MRWDRAVYYGTALIAGIIGAAIVLTILDQLCGCVPPSPFTP